MSYRSLMIYSLGDTDTPSRMSLYQKQWFFSSYTISLRNNPTAMQLFPGPSGSTKREPNSAPFPIRKKWCDRLKLAATYSPIRKALLRLVGPQGKLPQNLYFRSQLGRRWLSPGCSSPLVTSRLSSNVRVAKFVPE